MAEATGKNVEHFKSQYQQLESTGAFQGQNGLGAARKTAIDRFARLGLPSPTHEDWRFTSVAPLAKHEFAAASAGTEPNLERTDYALLSSLTELRAVFVNGFFSPALSNLDGLPTGVTVGSLAR